MAAQVNFTAQEFQILIEREDDRVELKTGVGIRPLQKALVAMSNTDGGRIFIGVNDKREVVGRRLDQGTDDDIHSAALAARNIGRYTIRQGAVDKTPIVVVTIEAREDEVAQTSDGRVLVRRGGRNLPLFGAELWHLMSSRTLRRFEASDSGVAPDAVSPDAIQAVADVHGWSNATLWPERWRERNLLHASGNLTVAGVLILADPTKQLGAAKFNIDLRSYESDTSLAYVRREIVAGPVQRQVEVATDWIMRDIGTEMVLAGTVRHDVPRLPRRPVRETVANAVAHRDYANERAPVVIEIRPSSVIVRSPGALPPPVTVATLREAQSARNHTVIDILRRFGLAEDSGQGIDVIQDGMRYELLDEPVFREGDASFEVTLPLTGSITATERGWLAELERTDTLRPAERQLLVAVLREERITNRRVREILGVGSVEARTVLGRLRDANLLRQHGERSRSYYTLGQLGPGRSDEAVVLEAAAAEPVSNQRVRELTGLERREALALLRRLVAQGRLVKEGSHRGTRYSAVAKRRKS